MSFAFDAVLFDLDGTLVATDRFWVAAAQRGAERAFAELGLERPPPTEADWMGLVGLPLDEGFGALFADLAEGPRAVVLERCLEEERAALAGGGAELLPGAVDVLGRLRELGVRTAIASNCGGEYLTAMLDGLDLRSMVDEAYCLDTPGIGTKTDMLRRLCAVFETRSAVMVGDRWTDAEAAWANGLPHVHLAHGFAPEGERIECEARIGGLGQLLGRLQCRDAWIDGALERIGAAGLDSIDICGAPQSGRTLFARDAARRARLLYGERAPRIADGSAASAREPGPGGGSGGEPGGAGGGRRIWLDVSAAVLDRRRAAAARAGGPTQGPSGPVGGPLAGDLVLGADNPLGPA